MFQLSIDLLFEMMYSRCRKGNVSVVRVHSRRTSVQTVWKIIYVEKKEKGVYY